MRGQEEREGFMQISTSIVLASALLLAPLAAQADDHRTAAPEGAAVYFITPEDGARVTSPVLVRFGLSGMGVAPDECAGERSCACG